MKRLLFYTLATLFCMEISAQKITCADSLKVFYTKYFTYDIGLENVNKLRALVSSYSTKDFYDAWYEEVYDIGFYDPLTRGIGGDPEDVEFMKENLNVCKEEDYYSVSFKFHGWQGDVKQYTIFIYINADGKISHVKRPTDDYMTPENAKREPSQAPFLIPILTL